MEAPNDLPEFAPRLDFGAALEPAGAILHGAGQDFSTWCAYAALMEQSGLRPDMFMAYCGLRGMERPSLERFKEYWDRFPADPPLLQLGLSMTADGQPEKCYAHEVADGRHDAAVRMLAEFLAENRKPALVRIGYECTGPWNGYEPESYVAAFRRVASILREYPLELATVWCVEGGWTEIAAAYYPGDEWADWWSVDLFSPDHFEKTHAFMEESLAHRKPVLIGECTPRRVGVHDGQLSWDSWYAPFFQWIARWPNVKGISYINWEWSGYEQWKDWGDARVEQNAHVLAEWIRHLKAMPLAGR